MPEPRFQELKLELLRGGVAPRHIDRMILELKEHYADLEEDGVRTGVPPAEAAREALASLGSERNIAAAALRRAELKEWTQRWPRLAAAVRGLDALVLLPLAPGVLCGDRGAVIARWGASISLSFLLTSGMLLTLRWVILSTP